MQAVTGAFGYSGKYMARRLLDSGQPLITLTNSVQRANPFGETLQAIPFNFDRPDALAAFLRGVGVLYNTYWVRFNHEQFQHASAVNNTLTLFAAAKKASVERIVHISITNPREDSDLEYFRGKAQLEKALMSSGLSYAILRPAVLFGKEDILINNIAWMLRKFPVFGVFGNGQYRLQPIYVDDLAKLAIEQGKHRENVIINAIGPETFTYRDLVKTLGQIIGKNRPLISISPRLGYMAGRVMSWFMDDVVITREEIAGLMADLLYVDAPPVGQVKLTEWARQHAEALGKNYSSELQRRRNRQVAYA